MSLLHPFCYRHYLSAPISVHPRLKFPEFETSLVDRLVAAGWRIARLWAVETKALDREMALETRDSDPDANLFDALRKLSGDLGPLSRTESRLDRQFYRPIPPASTFYPRESASIRGQSLALS